MIIKNGNYPTRVVDHMLGGNGKFIIEDILTVDKMHGKGRLFAKGTLMPGHSVGYHVHIKDMEICCFLSGKGIVEDEEGVQTEVSAGDTNIVDVGHGHKISSIGDEALVYIAVILFK